MTTEAFRFGRVITKIIVKLKLTEFERNEFLIVNSFFIILIASGMTFVIPGVIPVAHAQSNANLFVSAENSQFDNYMSGPQVIEVVVIDPDIADTDEGKGEPDVTVNGNDLRMVQGNDGYWYGYFADRSQAQAADATQPVTSPYGLQFGAGCTSATAQAIAGVVLTETAGVFFPRAIKIDTGTPAGVLNDCSGYSSGPGNFLWMHVIREPPTLSSPPTGLGQIGLNAGSWPFIQLYNFNPTGNVIVKYSKGGGDQIVTLTFDTVDQFATIELDKTKYSPGSQVHVTVTDLWLNMDPTDEDSWTWNTATGDAFYQVFNENGEDDADSPGATVAINPSFGSLMVEKNGVLLIDVDEQGSGDVVNLFDNNDQILTEGATADGASTPGGLFVAGDQPVTLTELSDNSGIFANYDESGNANIRVTKNALRGTSATIDYNETPTSIVVGFSFADVNWSKSNYSVGEVAVIEVIDEDMDLNSKEIGSFQVRVKSDTDQGGTNILVTETSENSGIFAGTVLLTPTEESLGNRLKVSHGDKITVEYTDLAADGFFTPIADTASLDDLPSRPTTLTVSSDKASYFSGDTIKIEGVGESSLQFPSKIKWVGTPRLIDVSGNDVSSLSIGQQVQITSGLTNPQGDDQPFAFLVQITDGKTPVSLAWITGSLSPGQSFSPALSWIPKNQGSFNAQLFLWDDVDAATPLASPQYMELMIGTGLPPIASTNSPIHSNIPVTIKIHDPLGNVIHVDQILTSPNGNYFNFYTADIPHWKSSGLYTIEAHQGTQKATTSFSFTFKETPPPADVEPSPPDVEPPPADVEPSPPDVEPPPPDVEPTPVCGPGTVLENGICVLEEKKEGEFWTIETIATVAGIGAASGGAILFALKGTLSTFFSSGTVGGTGSSTGSGQQPGPKTKTTKEPVKKLIPKVDIDIEVGFE